VLDPKDVNIGAELERLYKSKVFKAKKDEADRNPNENQKTVPKRALYDCDCMYFFGLNPRYENDQHGGKQANIEAMTVAAIAFEAEQWNKMFTKLDDKDLRKICSDVNKQAQEWLKKRTIDICQVSPKTVFKKLKNLRSFSTKYKEIMKAHVKIWHKSDIEIAEWLRGELGEVATRSQASLTATGFTVIQRRKFS